MAGGTVEVPGANHSAVAANWMDYAAKWGARCASLNRIPALLDAYPRDPAKASQPFPSPRSWTNLVKLLAAADSVGPTRMRGQLVHGTVGTEAGIQFLIWLSQQGLPDPEIILADPSSLRLPQRGDGFGNHVQRPGPCVGE